MLPIIKRRAPGLCQVPIKVNHLLLFRSLAATVYLAIWALKTMNVKMPTVNPNYAC